MLLIAGLVGVGSWQHRGALAEQQAAERTAVQRQRQDDDGPRATALEQRLGLVKSARTAVDDAVVGLDADGTDGIDGTGGPVWWPADLGARAAYADEPLDLQVMGEWLQAPGTPGVQRIGFRLVTGLPAASGSTPCQVPVVRITDWGWVQGGDSALGCRVMAAGVRGTAVREGDTGDGDSAVRLREVVLVSEGRAASVAVWSTGGAPLPLDGPALGAAAAALLVAGPEP
ncbi:hypothetical protein SAMN06264364_102256 [Quadrisphaera granulorum]|uniref:Uncharacterized protein n=1 Tax=Quadrisphaera granulorum TaxID=317664 RepID=A0A316AF43_9ACTN|nr:hypothetical protein BXY45_102256 [Quadrisphaera granulorum]SZE95385.1 hypothetical protein SAMN06264364_102256 [Quadrisphaera granulorum]